jgi:hypothetical protein
MPGRPLGRSVSLAFRHGLMRVSQKEETTSPGDTASMTSRTVTAIIGPRERLPSVSGPSGTLGNRPLAVHGTILPRSHRMMASPPGGRAGPVNGAAGAG